MTEWMADKYAPHGEPLSNGDGYLMQNNDAMRSQACREFLVALCNEIIPDIGERPVKAAFFGVVYDDDTKDYTTGTSAVGDQDAIVAGLLNLMQRCGITPDEIA